MSIHDRLAKFFFGQRHENQAPYDPGRDVIQMLTFVWGMLFLGMLSLLPPGVAHLWRGDWPAALIALATGVFLMGACTALGSFLGFVFGVPRLVAEGSKAEDENRPENKSEKRRLYQPNTNLEQISDWLTKIIVGVGLVEAGTLIDWIDQIGIVAGPAMWEANVGGRVIATAIVVHYTLMGFFQGFLVAYLYLPKAFANARRFAEDRGRATDNTQLPPA